MLCLFAPLLTVYVHIIHLLSAYHQHGKKGISCCCLLAAAAFGHICPASIPSAPSPFSLHTGNHQATPAHTSPKGWMESCPRKLTSWEKTIIWYKRWKGDAVFLFLEIEPLHGKHQWGWLQGKLHGYSLFLM